MDQQQNSPSPIRYSHAFLFGESPDFPSAPELRTDPPITDMPVPGRYIVRWAINDQEQQAITIEAGERTHALNIDAPAGAIVRILLFVVDRDENASKAVPYEFRVSGKRILRPPGATPAHCT